MAQHQDAQPGGLPLLYLGDEALNPPEKLWGAQWPEAVPAVSYPARRSAAGPRPYVPAPAGQGSVGGQVLLG